MQITSTTTEFVTLAEVKAHANVTTDANDVELDSIRKAAQEHVEALVGPVLWRTVTQTSTGYGSLVLHTTPVLTVDTVTYGGSPLTYYTSDTASGVVSGLPTATAVVVSYTAGRADCPESIRLATLIVAAHLWQTQLGNAPSGGALPSDELAQAPTGIGYATPARALDLLAPYMLPLGFA